MHERILVVEDLAAQAELARIFLAGLGFDGGRLHMLVGDLVLGLLVDGARLGGRRRRLHLARLGGGRRGGSGLVGGKGGAAQHDAGDRQGRKDLLQHRCAPWSVRFRSIPETALGLGPIDGGLMANNR